MAKSKIVKATEKMADSVSDGYKKIEKGVVNGYKKIEKGVVKGYQKIEDKFIDTYLTKDGETLEEAKSRLKKEEKGGIIIIGVLSLWEIRPYQYVTLPD